MAIWEHKPNIYFYIVLIGGFTAGITVYREAIAGDASENTERMTFFDEGSVAATLESVAALYAGGLFSPGTLFLLFPGPVYA